VAEGKGRQGLKNENRFLEIARESALECAAIHDVPVILAPFESRRSPHASGLFLREERRHGFLRRARINRGLPCD
jgi:hypothetical protein